jgi:hypothetical protein
VNTVYVDVPSNLYTGYQYNFKLHKDCSEVLRMQEGIDGKVKFVCNSAGGFSDGDVYELTFETPEDVTLYLVKNKFELIDKEIVDAHI